MEALSKFAAIGFASLGLLLGWLGAVVGFLLLACGIAGAIAGQVIWVLGCNVIAGARGRFDRLVPKAEAATKPYA